MAKQPHMAKQTFSRADVVTIISESFDTAEIRREVETLTGANLSSFGRESLALLREALKAAQQGDAMAAEQERLRGAEPELTPYQRGMAELADNCFRKGDVAGALAAISTGDLHDRLAATLDKIR